MKAAFVAALPSLYKPLQEKYSKWSKMSIKTPNILDYGYVIKFNDAECLWTSNETHRKYSWTHNISWHRIIEWEKAAKIYIECRADLLCHSHDIVMQADMTWETING